MSAKIRMSPPVCLGISLFKLLFGKLRISGKYKGSSVKMDDKQVFQIFRHISIYPSRVDDSMIVFIVQFKFARLSHKANKLASIIPMLLITGFPGFVTKMYAVNHESGYWQGMYQWKSKEHLEDYKKSFVFKMMNKRAIKESVSSIDFANQSLIKFIEKNRDQ